MIDTPHCGKKLHLDHAYYKTFFDEDILLDADVLLELLLEDQVLVDLDQEHFILDNIATIEGLLVQCNIALFYSSLQDLRR